MVMKTTDKMTDGGSNLRFPEQATVRTDKG